MMTSETLAPERQAIVEEMIRALGDAALLWSPSWWQYAQEELLRRFLRVLAFALPDITAGAGTAKPARETAKPAPARSVPASKGIPSAEVEVVVVVRRRPGGRSSTAP